MISWLSLALERIGGGFVVGETFAIQGFISEVELCVHSLGRTGS